MSLEDRIRASFAAQSMMATFGAEIGEIGEGRAVIRAPIGANALQQQGFAHAGLAFALGDSAAGYSALTLMDDSHEVLTSEMKIHLLAPAKGERMVAEGSVVKPGRRLIIAKSDVYTETGSERTHIATLLGTMVPVKL